MAVKRSDGERDHDGAVKDVRLSTTSYVVLGLIAMRGASTPYDLKRAVGHSVGYFWPFPHAQLYAEPERLAKAGLLTVTQEKGSRRRKIYSITDAGRDAVREWMSQEVTDPWQIRNIAEIKVFFAELGDTEDMDRLARGQIAIHTERIAEFEAMQQRFADGEVPAERLVPISLGLRLEEAALSFWHEQLPKVADETPA